MKQFIDQLAYDLYKREDTCEGGNEYDHQLMGARISSVFVILATSAIGAYLPVLSSRYSVIRMPSWIFFGAKYFGSGVIIATAFIHLLEPANDQLSNECLGGVLGEYPWAFGICLMSLFAIFLSELIAFNFIDRKIQSQTAGHSHSHFGDESLYVKGPKDAKKGAENSESDSKGEDEITKDGENPYPSHFSHAKDHQDPEVLDTPMSDEDKEKYWGQLVSVLALEFGIIFHSVFIGLTLAVSGDEFKTLYIVLVFHQMFEGLGLGTRIATTVWPKDKRWLPYVLCLGYALTTPISIAIGLGVRTTYAPGSRKALITNGVFDSLSAGILIYTGLVELLAHEFLFSDQFKGEGGFRRMITAYIVMLWGAGLMALLGRWA